MSNYQYRRPKPGKPTYVTGIKYCDKYLELCWFRFQGNAGTKMSTEYQPIMRYCTLITDWLNSLLPIN